MVSTKIAGIFFVAFLLVGDNDGAFEKEFFTEEDGSVHPNPNQLLCSNGHPCVPIVRCAPFYIMLSKNLDTKCKLPLGGKGVCCPPFNPRDDIPLLEKEYVDVSVEISLEDLNSASSNGLKEFEKSEVFEQELEEKKISFTSSSSSRAEFQHFQQFQTNDYAIDVRRKANKQQLTMAALVKRYGLSPQEAAYGLSNYNLQGIDGGDLCIDQTECGSSEAAYRYYSADGTCNNIEDPNLGSARTAYSRVTIPTYQNGYESPRTLSVTGSKLPSARAISDANINNVDAPDALLTRYHMVWGQWLDHDITLAAATKLKNDTGIKCCTDDGNVISSELRHPACFPIYMQKSDSFYGTYNQSCMNFVRSQSAPSDDCSLGYKEQLNEITHFIDGSSIYGSSVEDAKKLRLLKDGLLKTSSNNYLPKNSDNTFFAGDARVNEQPDLTIYHTIFVREHNRLAGILKTKKPSASDEELYQAARKINIAQHQHITYNEYVHTVIGSDYAVDSGLVPLSYGYTHYDSFVDPRILGEFSTAAFRFGHTTVQGNIQTIGTNQNTGTQLLHENFFKSQILLQAGMFNEFIRGGVKQPMQSFDTSFTESIQKRLFQSPSNQFGLDLIALNIQRGRDHGIGTYNDVRAICGLNRAQKWSDFRDFIRPEVIEKLKAIYADPNDVDLFVGGVSEHPAQGAVVGPTFRCIIGDQFQRLKKGDRLYYENEGVFTTAELQEIRKSSWARLLCDNGYGIDKMQPLPFRQQTDGWNAPIDCSNTEEIPSLNLSVFNWFWDKKNG